MRIQNNITAINSHREFIYFNDTKSKAYLDARKVWKDLIGYVYSEQPKCVQKYLEWVLED